MRNALFASLILASLACASVISCGAPEPSADDDSGDGPDGSNPNKPGVDGGPGSKVDGSAGDGGSTTDKLAETKKIKDLTGPNTSSKQFGVGGTDLGIPVRQPNGKIAYIFGDTFEGDGVSTGGWRSPVLLRSEPGNLAAGITFNGAAGGQYAKQILDYSHEDPNWSTWLPSDVITIGNRMYLHFIVNKDLGNVKWTQIAYSDDNGENWTLSNTTFAADDDDYCRQVWSWERGTDGYVYVMSTRFIIRDHPLIMYRVPEDKLLDHDAYVPWGYANGNWNWGNPATPILDGKFGEISLRRVENKWVLSWFNSGDYNISIKVFDSPTSNLHTATTYVPIKGGEWGFDSDTSVAQLYGGYIHPDSTLHNLHLIVSQWNTDTNTGGFHAGWPYRAMQFVTGVE